MEKENKTNSDDSKFYKEGVTTEAPAKIADDDGAIQSPYYGASESCNTLDTVVPAAMSIEQRRFNQRFKSAIAEMGTTVDEWVAKKLHYKTAAELCEDPEAKDGAGKPIVRFAREQIDAIGTAIWNYENNGDAIIIADQTGVGKGRVAAGILRYSILELKIVPFFFTEKKHLINDIYRDLIAIGFDAGIPYMYKTKKTIESREYTDEEILKIIRKDIKETDDVRVDYEFDTNEDSADYFNINLLRKELDDTHKDYERVESVKEGLIALYRQHIIENGLEEEIYEPNIDYDRMVVEALRKGKYLLRPFVPNRIDIKDTEGNILYPAMSNEEEKTIYKFKKEGKKFTEDPIVKISEFELPNKYKLFCMPYSQVATAYYDFNGKDVLKSKIKLFQKYSNGSVIVLDESHNASGMNPRGELSNTGEIIFQFVKNAKMTTYLSATYAKRATSMPLYALRTSIRESGLSDAEMIGAFMKGGNALQEAVSAELTRNGQLLRREKMIQGKSEYYYENDKSEIGLNQIDKLNRIAALYQKVLDFSQNVRDVIREYKTGLTADEKAKLKPARGVNALSFQLFNFMLLGLKVRQTTEFAINNLKAGKKTVITVASTLESALDNLSKSFMSNTNADSYKIGDKIKNDFSLYMAYLLNYTMRYYTIDVKVNDEGQEEESKQLVYVLDSNDELSNLIKDRCLGEYKIVLEEILKAETGIPIAPIDQIKQLIKAAGFRIDEITGRQRHIRFDKNSFAEGEIAKREIKKTDVVVREFNENEIDCLLINQSGATGISMHAFPNKKANKIYAPTVNDEGETIDKAPKSLSDKSEVKKRAMIITQMDLDINKEVQKLGRINRTGQVYAPEYTYIVSSIPSESRLTSLMEKKLRSLSANVSSNQEQSSYLFSSDDFFSDVAVEPFNQTMQNVGMRTVSVSTGNQIQDFTKTLYFKPYELQRDFYDTFSKLLTKEIETLKAQGLYTGKMTSKDYHAITKATFPFFIGDNNARTSFGRHSFIEKTSVTLYKEKNTEKHINQAITDKMHLKTGTDSADQGLFFSKLPQFQSKAFETLDKMLEEKQKKVVGYISEVDSEISQQSLKLTEKRTELSKYIKLEEGIKIEEELKDVVQKLNDASAKIGVAASEGNFDEVTRLGAENKHLGEKKKELEAKIVPYKSLLENKSEYKEIERELKRIESKLEQHSKGKERHYKSIEDFKRLIARTKDYLNKVGSMQQLHVLDEHIDYEDEETNFEGKPVYTPKYSEPVVITGVSFPFGEWDMTPGKVEVYMSGITEKFTYNIHQLHKEYDEEKTKLGYRGTIELAFLDSDYKGKWNEIAGQVDNSYREDRFVIIGSLLRTFTLANNNEITGQIIKYNTDSGKVRIGIEIADNKDLSNGKKPVYKVLEERYSEDNSLNYPVYYDGNYANVDRYITDYMYNCLFLETKRHIDEKIKFAENKIDFKIIQDEYSRFMFQISTSEKQVFIVVEPSEQLRTLSLALYEAYEHGKKTPSQIPDKEEFVSGLKVRILSDSVPATDFFAFHLKQHTDIEITNENYRINKSSKFFPDIEAMKYRSGRLGVERPRSGIFKGIFPTNIISLEGIINYGFEYQSELIMDYSDFESLIKVFDEKRRKPTFATSSSYFEQFKNEYVFEQFSDEFEKMSVTPNSEEFVAGQSAAEKEVSEMIDELVEILTK